MIYELLYLYILRRVRIDDYLKLQLQRLNCNKLYLKLTFIENEGNLLKYKYKCVYESTNYLLQKAIANPVKKQEFSFVGYFVTNHTFILSIPYFCYDGKSNYVTCNNVLWEGSLDIGRLSWKIYNFQSFPRSLQNTIFSEIERNIKLLSMFNQQGVIRKNISHYDAFEVAHTYSPVAMYCSRTNKFSIVSNKVDFRKAFDNIASS